MIEVHSLLAGPLTAAGAERLGGLLDPEERARAGRLRQAGARLAFLAAHALRRHCLSARVPAVPPVAWRFGIGPGGKPVVAGPVAGLDVSLAARPGCALAAVTAAGRLGVDVEAVGAMADPVALAESFFAPEEVARLRAAGPPEAARALAARFWTVKEAVLKATGAGLRQPLDSVLLAGGDPPRLVLRDPALGPAGSWHLWDARRGGFQLALALQHAAALPVRHRALMLGPDGAFHDAAATPDGG